MNIRNKKYRFLYNKHVFGLLSSKEEQQKKKVVRTQCFDSMTCGISLQHNSFYVFIAMLMPLIIAINGNATGNNGNDHGHYGHNKWQ